MIYVLLIEYIHNYLYISLLNLFYVSHVISLAWEDKREINELRFTCLFSRPIKVKEFAMQATIHDHNRWQHTGLNLTWVLLHGRKQQENSDEE